MEQTGEMVLVSAARLRELEELADFALKVKERHKADFERLSEYNKANPEKRNEVVNRWKEKNREAYNARRRELYRQKKEAAAAAQTPGGSLDPSVCPTN